MSEHRQFLLDLFGAAVGAVTAEGCLPAFLPKRPANGRTIVVGAGKGAAEMARVVEAHWPGPLEGIVVTRYGHKVPTRQIEVRRSIPSGA